MCPRPGVEAANPAAVPLALDDVTFQRGEQLIIDRLSFHLEHNQHWAIVGPNGSGKSTLLRIAALYEHPSSGSVAVLGERLGDTDVRRLRRRVGYAADGLARQFRTELTAADVVVTAKNAALEPWWDRYDGADWSSARRALDRLDVGHLADRGIATLSSGERQRVFLARTLMNDPALVLLDEPSAGLDIAGREYLVGALDQMMQLGLPTAIVTHHLGEIAPSTTHVLCLRDGRAIASGPIESTLTSEALSECFGLSLRVEVGPGRRYHAWAADPALPVGASAVGDSAGQ